MTNATRPSKNERRDAAREKARQARERQQRREKRNRAVLQLSIGVIIVAVVAVVALVLVNSIRPPGPGPANTASGGITISGPNLTAVRTAAPAADATPSPQATSGDGKVLIQAYEDFGCPVCQQFERANGAQIRQLVTSGAAEIQYHPVAFLDRNFTDGDYSTRAANAAAAVANYSPDAFYRFHSLLYQEGVQPEEGSAGLNDDRLIALVKQAGATNTAEISQAIHDERFKSWVQARTDEFLDGKGSLSAVDFPASHTSAGTPTLIVNGQYYAGDPADADAFGSFVTSVGGSSASPSPSASASASASPSATP